MPIQKNIVEGSVVILVENREMCVPEIEAETRLFRTLRTRRNRKRIGVRTDPFDAVRKGMRRAVCGIDLVIADHRYPWECIGNMRANGRKDVIRRIDVAGGDHEIPLPRSHDGIASASKILRVRREVSHIRRKHERKPTSRRSGRLAGAEGSEEKGEEEDREAEPWNAQRRGTSWAGV